MMNFTSRVLLLFGILIFSLTNSYSQTAQGTWKGDLAVMGQKLPLIIHLNESNGEWEGSIDSPSQGAMGIKMSKVLFDGMMLSFEMSVGNAFYEGVMVNEEIKGNFSQGGMKLPLDFRRIRDGIADEVMPRRPQHPVEPFDYEIKEVSFRNDQADIMFKGTLTTPSDEDSYPGVILISGSGPQNRDHEMMAHKPFWVMADYLTSRGIAVLRYDERGVGESSGSFADATTIDFMEDASAAIDFLKKQDKINPDLIGVIGHSEGGLITWMLGDDRDDLAFLISLAGPVMPITEMMKKQTEDVTRVAGASEEIVKMMTNRNQEVYKIIVDSETVEEVKPRIKALFEQELKELNVPESLFESELGKLQQAYEAKLDLWMLNFLKMDPNTYIQNIDIPTFAAFGSKDLQVNAAQNANRISEIFESKSDLLTLKVYENLNHLFQAAQTGAIDEYAKIEETINYQLLEDITDFILNQNPTAASSPR
ncbi:alpha/beta hydrolase family protein [Belliella kenyensis]|uniref:Alpha/beta hydrolase family protein n=1 Tax=Belliella kenyensis TaxID=1472724 RepID=A0ABV8ELN1_9BACT|nr:alpha/beta hydrolase [Belliella kenyensis]MCH7400349.1 alpha/beta hydrolase [Belliella kenyensis]MDN3604633.1 alpha/beta hydrolase [Belliella kenyensis]